MGVGRAGLRRQFYPGVGGVLCARFSTGCAKRTLFYVAAGTRCLRAVSDTAGENGLKVLFYLCKLVSKLFASEAELGELRRPI